eukprot:Clim_evm82s243 gene=Clim_evmTU82s243
MDLSSRIEDQARSNVLVEAFGEVRELVFTDCFQRLQTCNYAFPGQRRPSSVETLSEPASNAATVYGLRFQRLVSSESTEWHDLFFCRRILAIVGIVDLDKCKDRDLTGPLEEIGSTKSKLKAIDHRIIFVGTPKSQTAKDIVNQNLQSSTAILLPSDFAQIEEHAFNRQINTLSGALADSLSAALTALHRARLTDRGDRLPLLLIPSERQLMNNDEFKRSNRKRFLTRLDKQTGDLLLLLGEFEKAAKIFTECISVTRTTDACWYAASCEGLACALLCNPQLLDQHKSVSITYYSTGDVKADTVNPLTKIIRQQSGVIDGDDASIGDYTPVDATAVKDGILYRSLIDFGPQDESLVSTVLRLYAEVVAAYRSTRYRSVFRLEYEARIKAARLAATSEREQSSLRGSAASQIRYGYAESVHAWLQSAMHQNIETSDQRRIEVNTVFGEIYAKAGMQRKALLHAVRAFERYQKASSRISLPWPYFLIKTIAESVSKDIAKSSNETITIWDELVRPDDITFFNSDNHEQDGERWFRVPSSSHCDVGPPGVQEPIWRAMKFKILQHMIRSARRSGMNTVARKWLAKGLSDVADLMTEQDFEDAIAVLKTAIPVPCVPSANPNGFNVDGCLQFQDGLCITDFEVEDASQSLMELVTNSEQPDELSDDPTSKLRKSPFLYSPFANNTREKGKRVKGLTPEDAVIWLAGDEFRIVLSVSSKMGNVEIQNVKVVGEMHKEGISWPWESMPTKLTLDSTTPTNTSTPQRNRHSRGLRPIQKPKTPSPSHQRSRVRERTTRSKSVEPHSVAGRGPHFRPSDSSRPAPYRASLVVTAIAPSEVGSTVVLHGLQGTAFGNPVFIPFPPHKREKNKGKSAGESKREAQSIPTNFHVKVLDSVPKIHVESATGGPDFSTVQYLLEGESRLFYLKMTNIGRVPVDGLSVNVNDTKVGKEKAAEMVNWGVVSRTDLDPEDSVSFRTCSEMQNIHLTEGEQLIICLRIVGLTDINGTLNFVAHGPVSSPAEAVDEHKVGYARVVSKVFECQLEEPLAITSFKIMSVPPHLTAAMARDWLSCANLFTGGELQIISPDEYVLLVMDMENRSAYDYTIRISVSAHNPHENVEANPQRLTRSISHSIAEMALVEIAGMREDGHDTIEAHVGFSSRIVIPLRRFTLPTDVWDCEIPWESETVQYVRPRDGSSRDDASTRRRYWYSLLLREQISLDFRCKQRNTSGLLSLRALQLNERMIAQIERPQISIHSSLTILGAISDDGAEVSEDAELALKSVRFPCNESIVKVKWTVRNNADIELPPLRWKVEVGPLGSAVIDESFQVIGALNGVICKLDASSEEKVTVLLQFFSPNTYTLKFSLQRLDLATTITTGPQVTVNVPATDHPQRSSITSSPEDVKNILQASAQARDAIRSLQGLHRPPLVLHAV